MVYKMLLTDVKGKRFAFYGVKYIHRDHFGETGLEDTTTLFVDMYEGVTAKGNALGKAVLYIQAPNFAKQLSSIEITNTESRFEKLKWTAKFGQFFAKSLWDTYGPVTAKPSTFDPDAPPRAKRPLRVNGVTPVVHKCVTEDNVSFERVMAVVSLCIHFLRFTQGSYVACRALNRCSSFTTHGRDSKGPNILLHRLCVIKGDLAPRSGSAMENHPSPTWCASESSEVIAHEKWETKCRSCCDFIGSKIVQTHLLRSWMPSFSVNQHSFIKSPAAKDQAEPDPVCKRHSQPVLWNMYNKCVPSLFEFANVQWSRWRRGILGVS